MRQFKRALSIGLAAVMVVTGVVPAYAEPGEPVCDETLYVTLDPYGKVTESSVVKGYDMNGSARIVDHGNYERVTNMTDYGEAQIGEDGAVIFNVENPEKRFYFEGRTKTLPRELPWTISVSYRLNGVDKKAEDLAGASGLVEINVDLLPNKQADAYYRNNMMLEMATVYNVDDILSLEAPGAQIQALGNMKAVVFLALPGEEEHFTVRVGSDSFESAGLIFMMQPVTVGQLDKITDLKEAKETIEDSADAISDSLDVLLDSLDSLNKGLGDTMKGLDELDNTRQYINSTKGEVYASADEALDALTVLSMDMEPFVDHIKTGQQALDDLNGNLNELVYTLDDLSPKLEDMRYDIRALVDDVNKLADILDKNSQITGQQARALIAKLKADLEALKGQQGELSGMLLYLSQLIPQLAAGVNGLSAYADASLAQFDSSGLESMVEELADMGLANTSELKQVLKEEYGLSNEIIQKILPVLKQLIGGAIAKASMSDAEKALLIEKIVRQLSALLQGAGESVGSAQFINQLEMLIAMLEQDAANAQEQLSVPAKSLFSHSSDLALSAAGVLRVADDLISGVDTLNSTMNDYHHDAQGALEDAETLIETAVKGVNTLQGFFATFEEEIKIAGNSLNKGTELTLKGLREALESAMNGILQTTTIRDAKATIKNLIDDKWDEYTGEDNNLLSIDTEAPFLSFTSDENPEPESIQVILRTGEITVDDEETAAEVDEDFHSDGNFVHRIGNILKKIWTSIVSIFK